MQDIINQTIAALRDGKTILYPTDTIWGIGCDATNHDAVEKIYQIKERDHSKSLLVLALPDQIQLPPACQANIELTRCLFAPEQPTTVILPDAESIIKGLASNLPASDRSIGVRIPQHDFCRLLLKTFGKPIVSTSANLSGRPSPTRFEEIEDELKQRIDLLVPNMPEFRSNTIQSSRILKLQIDGSLNRIR